MLTHFLASLDEATRRFDIFNALTLRELEFWFPDPSGILSQLPPTWTVQHAADQVASAPFLLCWPRLSESASTSVLWKRRLPGQDLRRHRHFQLRCVMPSLLAPVVETWPHCAARVRALSDSGDLQRHAEEFRNSRGGVYGHPGELLSGLLPPAPKKKYTYVFMYLLMNMSKLVHV